LVCWVFFPSATNAAIKEDGVWSVSHISQASVSGLVALYSNINGIEFFSSHPLCPGHSTECIFHLSKNAPVPAVHPENFPLHVVQCFCLDLARWWTTGRHLQFSGYPLYIHWVASLALARIKNGRFRVSTKHRTRWIIQSVIHSNRVGSKNHTVSQW
jgi:hypothetical protein